MSRMINQIGNVVNDLRYAFLSIFGWTLANVPHWIADLAEIFVVLAQIFGGLAAILGVLKMIEQLLYHKFGVNIFKNVRKRNTGK